mgnify:FL=1|jgi:hypothetical protein
MIVSIKIFTAGDTWVFLPSGSTKFEFLKSKNACRISDHDGTDPWFLFLRFLTKNDYANFLDAHQKKYFANVTLQSPKVQYGKKYILKNQVLKLPYHLHRCFNCKYL